MKAQELNVTCDMTGQFQWEALPGWGTCDFSRVQLFNFEPRAASDILSPSWGAYDLVADRAADATAAVLKKCNNSLEEFRIADDPMIWPGHEVISLPKLRKLSLGHGYIRPCNLRKWMAEMSSLENFVCVGTKSYGDGTWVDVFDAIRNHPRGMKVEFDQIHANFEKISIDYYTDDFQEYLQHKAHAEDWPDVTLSLPLYLSGKLDMDEATMGESFTW